LVGALRASDLGFAEPSPRFGPRSIPLAARVARPIAHGIDLGLADDAAEEALDDGDLEFIDDAPAEVVDERDIVASAAIPSA